LTIVFPSLSAVIRFGGRPLHRARPSRRRRPSLLKRARLTQIDYDREMAFIAIRKRADGSFETLGVVRPVADPDNIAAEFAIIVRSDLKDIP
jgi:acetyltransferase